MFNMFEAVSLTMLGKLFENKAKATSTPRYFAFTLGRQAGGKSIAVKIEVF